MKIKFKKMNNSKKEEFTKESYYNDFDDIIRKRIDEIIEDKKQIEAIEEAIELIEDACVQFYDFLEKRNKVVEIEE